MGGINHQKLVVYYCYTHINRNSLALLETTKYFVYSKQNTISIPHARLSSDRCSRIPTTLAKYAILRITMFIVYDYRWSKPLTLVVYCCFTHIGAHVHRWLVSFYLFHLHTHACIRTDLQYVFFNPTWYDIYIYRLYTHLIVSYLDCEYCCRAYVSTYCIPFTPILSWKEENQKRGDQQTLKCRSSWFVHQLQ